MKSMSLTHGVAVCLATLFAAANANAQIMSDAPPAPPAQPAPPAAPAAQPVPAPPAMAQAPIAAAPADAPIPNQGGTDHDRVVGHMGVTYFGVENVPIGTGGTGSQNLQAPVLGIRYWLKSNLGLDAGVGLWFNNSSTTTAGTSTNNPSTFALILHGGVPIALATGQHYVFEVIPEANLGFSSGSASGTMGGPSTSFSGLRFDLGARVGGEVSFGFIGVPQLSLVASVGLFLQDLSWSTSPSGGSSSGGQNLTLSTSVQNNPWSIFADNIAAIYYF